MVELNSGSNRNEILDILSTLVDCQAKDIASEPWVGNWIPWLLNAVDYNQYSYYRQTAPSILSQLAKDNSDNQELIREAGGIPVLVELFVRDRCENSLRGAMDFYQALCANDNHKRAFVEAGGIAVFVELAIRKIPGTGSEWCGFKTPGDDPWKYDFFIRHLKELRFEASWHHDLDQFQYIGCAVELLKAAQSNYEREDLRILGCTLLISFALQRRPIGLNLPEGLNQSEFNEFMRSLIFEVIEHSQNVSRFPNHKHWNSVELIKLNERTTLLISLLNAIKGERGQFIESSLSVFESANNRIPKPTTIARCCFWNKPTFEQRFERMEQALRTLANPVETRAVFR